MRSKGEGSIRQRSDGTWEARVTTGHNPGTGKAIRRSVYGKTQAEVRKKMTEIISSVDKGTYSAPTKMRVQDWLDTWLRDYTGGIKDQSRLKYGEAIEVHLKPAFGAILLSNLKPHMIQKFYNDLSKNGGRNGTGFAPKSIKNLNGIFHKALQQAVSLQYIPSNPCDLIQLPKVVKPDLKTLNEAEINCFLKEIQGSDYETILKVALFTGMRLGEIMGMTWDRIDFEQGTLLIDRQLIFETKKGGKYLFAPTKTDRIRKLRPAPFVMSILKERRKQQIEDRLAAGDLWSEGDFSGLVFTNRFGQHFGRNSVSRSASRAARAIGVPGFRFHDLRHSYAVSSIRAGDDMKTISSNLGHSTVALTMDVYAAYTSDMAKDSADRMEAYSKRFSNL